MEPFATVDDLLAGWPNKTMNDSERSSADALLRRASAQLASLMRNKGRAIDPSDDIQAENLRTVTVNMVRRSMMSGAAEGIKSVSQTIGSTTASAQWSNPDGAFYLSSMDKEVLGLLGGGRVGWASMAGDP
jgi:hypothetical protein